MDDSLQVHLHKGEAGKDSVNEKVVEHLFVFSCHLISRLNNLLQHVIFFLCSF